MLESQRLVTSRLGRFGSRGGFSRGSVCCNYGVLGVAMDAWEGPFMLGTGFVGGWRSAEGASSRCRLHFAVNLSLSIVQSYACKH